MEQQNNNQEEILYLGFNQDQGCFSCGTDNGFKIFNTYPFQEQYNCDLQGGIGQVEMLYRSNVLALVGGGPQPKYYPTKLILWDDHRVKCLGEMSFKTEVKSVKLKANIIVVVLESKIFIYNFSDLKLIDHIETCPNPLGLCSLDTQPDENYVLACPDSKVGYVKIQLKGEQKTQLVKAHHSVLNALQLNATGTKLATASQKGTIIRIFNPENGEKLQELRRGSEYAQIYSLAFDPQDKFIACSSDSGTIHIFCLDKDKQKDQQQQSAKNHKSKMAFLKGLVPYFDSEWSFAQFRVIDNKTKVAFGPEPNSIIVISYEGKYYKANFDPEHGGECDKKEEFDILKNEEKQQQSQQQ